MTEHVVELERLAELRSRAANRLQGPAAAKGSVAKAADALAVLHALASSPATASDALTLLHELQVHQVELDLQAQELQDSRAELECALRRQIELHDALPVACLSIDAALVLHELNQTAADMLGLRRADAQGLRLDAFMRADSVQRMRSVMSNVGASVRQPSCPVILCSKDGSEWPMLASVGLDPAGQHYLVSLMNAAE